MPDKKAKLVHAPGEFQLNKNELLADVPFLLKGIAGQVIDYVNELNINGNDTSDLAEYMPFVLKALPILVQLAPLVNLSELKLWFVDHKFVADKAAALAVLDNLAQIAGEAHDAIGKQ